MDIKELKQHFDSANTEVKNLVERQSDEVKSLGQASEETANQLKQAEKRLEEVSGEFGDRLNEVEKRLQRAGDAGEQDEAKTAGEMFINSDAYQAAKSRGLNSTDAVEMKTLMGEMSKKDITAAAASAGAVATSQRIMNIFRDPADRQNHIRDLLGVSQTTQNAIEYYVDHLGFTNNAGAQNGELTLKNKSDLTLEEKTAAVKTIAHHVIASRQVLSDAPMLRSYIDGRLRYGLALEEDAQILYGDGTAGTLEGIMTNANIQNVGQRQSGEDRLAQIRRAITKARLAHYPVDGIALNPEDWEAIELTQDANGNYIWMWYMASNGEPRMFRVPVVETTAINSGDFLLGSWSMAATLWDREQASVRVSDSHSDLFVKNGVAILGEERLALTVERPQAFVKGDFTEVV